MSSKILKICLGLLVMLNFGLAEYTNDVCTSANGSAFASSEYSTHIDDNAFDDLWDEDTDGTYWGSNNGALPEYIGFHFNSAKVIKQYRIYTSPSPSYQPSAWQLEGSNSGENSGYTTLHTGTMDPSLVVDTWYTFNTNVNPSDNSYTYYRIKITDVEGTTVYCDIEEIEMMEEIPASAPTASTNAATSITTSSVQLNGTINPNYAETTVTFEYGLTTSYGSTITADQSPVTGSTNTSVSKLVTGLSAGTTYHFRVKGVNSEGTTYGADQNFTTSTQAPTVTTQAVGDISTTTATGNGNITSLGAPNPTQHGVCWSTSENPTTSNSKTEDGGASSTGAFTSSITGLSPNTTYYVKAYATNTAGTVYGDQVSFTTTANAPSATTDAADNITSSSATLNGTVNPNGVSTTVTFEYGTTTSYGSTATVGESPVTESSNTSVSAGISSLSPNVTYHYRVKAISSGGTTYGSDQTFTTSTALATVTTSDASSVSKNSANLGGEVTNAGGGTVTERGVVYSRTDNTPEIAEPGVSKDDNSSGTGTFSEEISSFFPDETYYFRTYAINGAGIAYGTVKSFTTGKVSIGIMNGAHVSIGFQQTSPTPPESNWLCGKFRVSCDANGATLGSITITLGGAYLSGDLQSTPLQLYGSFTDDFSTASPIGGSFSDPGTGNTVTFNMLNDVLATGSKYYWLTADISATASSTSRIHGSILSADDVVFTSATIEAMISSYGLLNAGDDVSLPVSISQISLHPADGNVEIRWITESEINNKGFIIERKSSNISIWSEIASYLINQELIGQGNSTSPIDYSFVDETVVPGETYVYRLSDVSESGMVRQHPEIEIALEALPENTCMDEAYPNPFNPTTLVKYHLANNAKVNISVYDIRGHLVKELCNKYQSAGNYQVYWHGDTNNGIKVTSGNYIIQMISKNKRQVQKVVLMK